MYEMLGVLIIYTLVSFAGMATLWTIAVKKGAIARPAFFFWIKVPDHYGYAVESGDAANIIGLDKIQGRGVPEYSLAANIFRVSMVYGQTGAQGAPVQNQVSQSSERNRGFSLPISRP